MTYQQWLEYNRHRLIEKGFADVSVKDCGISLPCNAVNITDILEIE
jgi:hypothetical protein